MNEIRPFLPAAVLLTTFFMWGCNRGQPSSSSSKGTDASSGGKTKDMTKPDLMNPASLFEQAPEEFKVRFETTKGDVVLAVHRSWAPRGADRFYNLVRSGFYDGVAFFRVIKGFMAQTGIHKDPEISARWSKATIQDDPVEQSNTRGMVSFATSGPNSRTTQFFVNFGDNSRLDRMGFAPFAEVAEGIDVIDELYSGYGEGAPSGNGPMQSRIHREGNAYLKKDFERLDYINRAHVE